MSLGGIFSWLRREFAAARFVFLFFLAGFLLVLLIVKLALAQYSIESAALGRAVVGALIAAKVVLVFDETPLGRLFRTFPRIISVAYKTLAYGLGFIVLSLLERTIDAWRELGAPDAALHYVTEQMGIHRLLSLALGITLVFFVYFTFSEISDHVGKDVLRDLFLKRPQRPD